MVNQTVYKWGEAPEELKTRRQLAELGLRPGGPEVARIVWGSGRQQRFAALYAVADAQSKKPATPAQLAALAKARARRETCPACGGALGFVPGWRFDPWLHCPHCIRKRFQEDREKATQRARAALSDARAVIVDTETTDLDGFSVQIAVLGMDGTVYLDTLVNPLAPIAPEAQAIHGLTAEVLAGAPVFGDIEAQLRDILTGRPVWAYNADFDKGILAGDVTRLQSPPIDWTTWRNWARELDWHCAMRLYAAWYGEWSTYHQDYRWQRLPGGDHTALGDCRATWAVLRSMAEDKPPD